MLMHRKNGQTMIELLIAFFVISVGLFAAVTLVFSNMNLVERDTDEVVAVNLAREGIELAKEVRDSNWLAGNAFDVGLANGVDYTATPIWEGTLLAPATGPSFSFVANTLGDADARVITTTAGLFANANAAASIDGTATKYFRLLTFHPICSDDTTRDSGADCGGMTKIGVRVEAHVQWTRKTGLGDLTLYEDLYDWR